MCLASHENASTQQFPVFYSKRFEDSATPEESEDYENELIPGPVAEDKVCWAYMKPPTHTWNQCAADFFTRAFFGAKKAKWFDKLDLPVDLTHSQVEEAFLSRFYDFKKKWLDLWKNVTPEQREAKMRTQRRDKRRNTVCLMKLPETFF